MLIQLIFEELIFELLIKQGKNTLPLKMTIMYNEENDDCEIKINYGGEKNNPLEQTEDILSLIHI